MIPLPFKPLWENPTFANCIRSLPTVLTFSLFMLFGLLEVALACLKWMLFVLIIAATFLFGLGLLMISMLVLVGILIGSLKEEGAAEVLEDLKQDMPAEQKVEQKEAVPDSDIEEKTTHLARKLVVLATSDDVTLDIENVLEEFGGEDECRDKLRLGEGGGSTRD